MLYKKPKTLQALKLENIVMRGFITLNITLISSKLPRHDNKG